MVWIGDVASLSPGPGMASWSKCIQVCRGSQRIFTVLFLTEQQGFYFLGMSTLAILTYLMTQYLTSAPEGRSRKELW